MPTLTGVITSGTISSDVVKIDATPAPVLLTVPAATLRQLHTELAAAGLPVDGAESGGTPQFGPDTQARVGAFQQLYGLPVTRTVDPETGALLSLVAMAMTESDGGKLRAGLRAAQSKAPRSPRYNDALARFAIIAGDYDLAVRVRDTAATAGLVANAVTAGAATGGALAIPDAPRQAPEIPFPENFYSYRFEVMSQDVITELRTRAPAVASLSLAAQANITAAAAVGDEPAGGGQIGGPPVVSLRPIGDPGTDDPPGVPEVPPSQPPTPPGPDPIALANSARAFLDAVEGWQLGNAELANGRYASAVRLYNTCQLATLDYFRLVPGNHVQLTASTLAGRVDELIVQVVSDPGLWSDVSSQINFRRQLLSLIELGQYDWTSWSPVTREHG